jgi:hypothetical protein
VINDLAQQPQNIVQKLEITKLNAIEEVAKR